MAPMFLDKEPIKKAYLKVIVKAALAEDLGIGDITTNSLISASAKAKARLVFKSDGVVCGLNIAEYVFNNLNQKISFRKMVPEGGKVKKQTTIAVIEGSARAILTAERVAINFLTHLSAIATKTRAFVEAVKPYSSQIYD